MAKDDDPEATGRSAPNWDPSLPEPPDDWEDELTLDVTPEEAVYLVDRAQTSIGRSLFAELLGRGQEVDAPFPWMVDDQAHLQEGTRRALDHARWFSESIHGAQLLYNLMVAELVAADGGDSSYVDAYREWFGTWAEATDAAADERRQWDHNDFWRMVLERNPRIPPAARSLIDGWLVAIEDGAAKLADDPVWRQQLEAREVRLKKGLARLRNRRARELWNGGSGSGQLNFRWPEASTAISDIARGLGGDR